MHLTWYDWFVTKTAATKAQCPGSLQPAGPAVRMGYGRHHCTVCAATRFPKIDGTMPRHRVMPQHPTNSPVRFVQQEN